MSRLVSIARRPVATYPVSGFDGFERVFDNLFRNALTNISSSAGSVGDLAVHVDVSETDKSYLISTDLPGLEEKDVELTVHDGVLTLKGEKHSRKDEEGKTWHRTERSYGNFQRTMQLPVDADENQVTAKMKNGVLEIEIGKTKESVTQARRIDIARS